MKTGCNVTHTRENRVLLFGRFGHVRIGPDQKLYIECTDTLEQVAEKAAAAGLIVYIEVYPEVGK